MSNTGREFDKDLYAKFASLKNPEKTINHLYVWSNERSLVIHEEWPKSKMHFKLIPRVGAPPRVPANLKNLYTLLHSSEVGKEDAETILKGIKEDAEVFKAKVEEEMIERHDFVWPIWMGFRVPSSHDYLHLHIMSDDLTGTGMKKPEHFFHFHPKMEQFCSLDEVLTWFEIRPEAFKRNVEGLRRKAIGYPESERELDCYFNDGIECNFRAKNFPDMKEHLKEHWEKRKKEAERRKETREKYERYASAQRAKLEAEAKKDGGHADEEGDPQRPPPDTEGQAAQD